MWVCLFLVAVLCIPIKLVSVLRNHSTTVRRSDAPGGAPAFFLVLFSFHLTGLSEIPHLSSGRCTSFFILLFGYLMYQYYSASIVGTLLMEQPKSIKTLRNLIDSRLTLGIEDIPYSRDYFVVSVWLKFMPSLLCAVVVVAAALAGVDRLILHLARGSFGGQLKMRTFRTCVCVCVWHPWTKSCRPSSRHSLELKSETTIIVFLPFCFQLSFSVPVYGMNYPLAVFVDNLKRSELPIWEKDVRITIVG